MRNTIFIAAVLLFLAISTFAQESRGTEIIRLDIAGATQVEWSSDLSRLAVLEGKQISVWDAENWELLYTIPDAYVYAIAWHPSKDIIAGVGGGREERLRLWDGVTGDLQKEISRPLPDTLPGIAVLHALTWSPDGRYVATDSVIDTITLWDIDAETYTTLVPASGPDRHGIIELEWSDSGDYLLSGGLDGRIRVWNAHKGESLLKVEGYRHVAWHPDEICFAGASSDTALKVWNIEDGEVEAEFLGHTRTITSVDWNPDSNSIASTDADGHLLIWNFATGNQEPFDLFNNVFVSNARWKPDGHQLAVMTREAVTIISW